MKIGDLKVVWRVSDKPTGRYRSFQGRDWPSAFLGHKDGNIIFNLTPVEKGVHYYPNIAESTDLMVRIMDWRGEKPIWLRLKRVCHGVTSAKRYAHEFLKSHPEYAGN